MVPEERSGSPESSFVIGDGEEEVQDGDHDDGSRRRQQSADEFAYTDLDLLLARLEGNQDNRTQGGNYDVRLNLLLFSRASFVY